MAAGRVIPLLLVAGLFLAGCMGGRGEAPSSRPLAEPDELEEPATLLRILVINDEFLPVQGAKVSVVGLGLNSTTDDVGNAYFQIGAPGRYAVRVHRAGFYPNTSKVTVDGDPSQVVRITLRDAPHNEFYADFYYFQGFCGPTLYVQGASDGRCQPTPYYGGRPYPRWFTNRGLTHAFFLLDWDEPVPVAQRMRLEFALPDAGAFADGRQRIVAEGAHPVRMSIPHELLTPKMQQPGQPIELLVGLAPETPVAFNAYQNFVIEAELDYFVPAPDVDPDS